MFRQSRVHKTYCFPRSQSISVKYFSATNLTSLHGSVVVLHQHFVFAVFVVREQTNCCFQSKIVANINNNLWLWTHACNIRPIFIVYKVSKTECLASFMVHGCCITVSIVWWCSFGCGLDISYTLDGASHAVGRGKLKPDRKRWSFPGLTRSMIIWVFCIAKMDKVDNKSSFMQLKSI